LSLAIFAPSDFVTIGLLIALEGLLSADNAMVLAILVLGLPKADQKKALKYGIAGAFAFRTVATLLALYLIQLGWVKLVGAGYLLYLVYRHFGSGASSEERRAAPKAQPWMGLSAFWATVVKVELTDIVFAVDSILVAVAMSPKKWVILTGGILGIAMMRLVIGKLLALVERYPVLVDAAFVIIAWVGVKLLIEYGHSEGYIGLEVPKLISLGVIVAIFASALMYALIGERRAEALRHETEPRPETPRHGTERRAEALRHNPEANGDALRHESERRAEPVRHAADIKGERR
jgi:YkoY family integral membrane protein